MRGKGLWPPHRARRDAGKRKHMAGIEPSPSRSRMVVLLVCTRVMQTHRRERRGRWVGEGPQPCYVPASAPPQRTASIQWLIAPCFYQAMPSTPEREMNYLLTMHLWNPVPPPGKQPGAPRFHREKTSLQFQLNTVLSTSVSLHSMCLVYLNV